MLVLRAFDILIHTIYPLILSPEHSYFDTINYSNFRQVFVDYCNSLDKIIGKILKKLDNKTTLLITSDHGCAPIYRYLYPAPLLQKLGLLKLKRKNNEEKISKTKEIFKEKFYDLLGKANLLTTVWLRYYRFRKFLGKTLKLSKGKTYLSGIDLENSKVIPFGHQTLIVRCKNEIEAKNIAKRVKKLFTSLIDPATKEKPVIRIKTIRPSQEENLGKYQIFLEMEKKYEINKLIRGTMFRRSFKGKHAKKGIFIGFGPEFSEKKQIFKEDFNCWDIPPTILTLFDISIPNWMEGHSLISEEEDYE